MPELYVNGIIHTLASGTVSAMAVEGGRLIAVGSDAALFAAYPAYTKIDLEGRCVVPGFNDSHCHLLGTGMRGMQLELYGVSSFDEIIERAHSYIAIRGLKRDGWIVGDGFDHNHMREKALPDRRVADAISLEHPVLIERVCGHVGTVNTRAIELLGLDAADADGAFDRDESGRLTGVVRETGLSYVRARVPKPDMDTLKEALREGMARFNRHGVTSVQSDDLEGLPFKDFEAAIADLRISGEWTLRVFEEAQAPDDKALYALIEHAAKTGAGDEWYRIGNVKLLADGSLGARTAYLRLPYSGGGETGVRVYSDEALIRRVGIAHRAGMQVAVHAIGDGAAEQCVRAVEMAQGSEWKDLRHRIVHGQILGGDLIDRIARAGIAVDIQPAFVASDWPMVLPLLGEARAEYAYAWRTLLGRGVPMAAGSDSPVEECDPIFGIYCAATRKDASGAPDGGFMPGERLTPYEALWLYTAGGARLSFEEHVKGTLAPGMLADFAVLSEDILAVEPDRIKDIRVLMTVVGGRVCYRG